jgi:2'-5' RNA ligase
MRLFIGIDIPKEIKEKIKNSFLYAKDTLEFAYFVNEDNFHITLVFLGEVPDFKINLIKEIIKKVSANFYSKILEIDNPSIGPDEIRPRMIWLKLSSNSNRYLEEISKSIKKELKIRNIYFENSHKDLNSHITLARFSQDWQNKFMLKNKIEKFQEIKKIKETFPNDFKISFYPSRITLFLSRKDEGGQRIYEPIFESNLIK